MFWKALVKETYCPFLSLRLLMKFMFCFTILVQKVNFEVKKLIQQGRMAKKMTQADLAKAINEKATVVNDYESGRAVPSQQILAKMERILGVKLRGKKK